MVSVLLVTFTITLFYLAIVNRLTTFTNVLAFQGILLFGLAFIQLIQINVINLVFVLLETIVFKTIAVPRFLNYIIKRNKISREAEPYISNFSSLLIITAIIIIAFLISDTIKDNQLNRTFFVIALSTLFTGLYLIISRRKIITHVMGFLVIENGVFILSLSIGSEMPMIINLGITLDIFISILLLGIFLNQIGDVFEDVDVKHLRSLKD